MFTKTSSSIMVSLAKSYLRQSILDIEAPVLYNIYYNIYIYIIWYVYILYYNIYC